MHCGAVVEMQTSPSTIAPTKLPARLPRASVTSDLAADCAAFLLRRASAETTVPDRESEKGALVAASEEEVHGTSCRSFAADSCQRDQSDSRPISSLPRQHLAPFLAR